jgi:predicted Zn-dependent peptidase
MDVVPTLTANDVKEFHQNFYTGENIVVVATGKVNHSDVVDQVE